MSAQNVSNVSPDSASTPEVTVVCITYKHEDYIREALDSFLMQKTTFRYQIFVGEDCGPDGTADIIREYAAKYPGVVIPFIRETNMGAQRNLIDMCQRAGTKYIAFCEGDDYWTDEYKLQKQYDHMEANPELSGCIHNTEIISDDDWYLTSYFLPDADGRRLIPYSIPGYDQSVRAMRMGYYVRYGPAHTSSMFFKWNYDLEIPDWYYQTIFGDHPIMMMQIGRGLLGFLPDVMGAYRRHAGGAIMNNSERSHHLATREDWLVVLEGLAVHFRENYGDYCAKEIRARMVTEMRNYLAHAVRSDNKSSITEVIARHPLAFELMVVDYAQTSRLRYRLIGRLYGTDPAGLRDQSLAEAMTVVPYRRLLNKRQAARRNRVTDYDRLAARPKKPGLWLFMCDDKVSYRGNVRSLYEYVVANHPDIRVYWLTRSATVERLLNSEGLPVCLLKTSRSVSLLSRAEVLFCESLRSDIFEMRGFNAASRVVRVPDNRYFHNGEHLMPFAAIETRVESDPAERAEDSPMDWRTASNLVITDSGALAEQLRLTEAAAEVVQVATEPRLLAIPESLTPVGRRHLLFSPGGLSFAQAESVVMWLIGNVDAIDELAREHGFVLDLYLPAAERFHSLIQERVADREHIQLLKPFDIHALLARFAGAVCGVDPLSYGLVRAGVPVSVCTAGKERSMELLAGDGELLELLPGPVTDDWMEALTSVVERMDAEPSLPENAAAIEARFGITLAPDEGSPEAVLHAVNTWLKGAPVR